MTLNAQRYSTAFDTIRNFGAFLISLAVAQMSLNPLYLRSDVPGQGESFLVSVNTQKRLFHLHLKACVR